MRVRFGAGLTLLSSVAVLAHPRDAAACGGFFIQAGKAQSTVVTAHRMAFAFSPARTVLWDQIQYTGEPEKFSWVLPVRGDVTLQVGENAWFGALEAVTNTTVAPPTLNCFSKSSAGNGGCGSSGSASLAGGSSGSGGAGVGVTVLHADTVGPYHWVRLSATSSQAILDWLPAEGYAIPADVRPVIATYVDEGFDFIAVKLQPTRGVREMKPIRVVTGGGSPQLPLRMVAAGTGPFVGVTLYVIGEGRYEPSNFSTSTVDFTKVTWNWHNSFNWSDGTTNYAELRQAALAAGDGKGWLATYAERAAFTKSHADGIGQSVFFATSGNAGVFGAGGGSPVGGGPKGQPTFGNFTELYFAQAAQDDNRQKVCANMSAKLLRGDLVIDTCRDVPSPAIDAGSGKQDASPSDAAPAPRADAAEAKDGGATRVCDPAPVHRIAANTLECNTDFTDIAAAMIGMHPSDVWITRLEANLPHAALSTDLVLKPSASQSEVASAHRATVHLEPPCELLENHPPESRLAPSERTQPLREAGVGFVSTLGLFLARRLARRRALPQGR
ncbi:MAG TPA: DUF2330 domain-containing protein [Polyangiaceae bacterium]|nr:DUF2330 domain-containing protein [Polyangiaceae bacterium]